MKDYRVNIHGMYKLWQFWELVISSLLDYLLCYLTKFVSKVCPVIQKLMFVTWDVCFQRHELLCRKSPKGFVKCYLVFASL
jgi:hypothetical protein